MRWLVMSDIHSNLEALQAVLGEAHGYDAVLFLGDLVGYGPDPNECTALVRSLPQLTSLVGNHDLAALGKEDTAAFNDVARYAAEWTSTQMDGDTRAFLEHLESRRPMDGLTLVHASPRDSVWEYLEAVEQGSANFNAFNTALCFNGHTHVPRVFALGPGGDVRLSSPEPATPLLLREDHRYMINPGGVGQPRDGDPRAAFGLYDDESHTFGFHRVAYPIETTQKKMLEAQLPEMLAWRLSMGM